MAQVQFFSGESVPLEMHKVRVVQKLSLLPVWERQKRIAEAGNNTFLLKNRDIFLDMLTDSGVNAMSDRQMAAMMIADDSYAGSETFFRLEQKLHEIFGMDYFLPTHQGRAAENILAETYVRPGTVIPMNFHFTTTKAHITRLGGRVEELIIDEGLITSHSHPFKGNVDLNKLRECIERNGAENIPFIRIEAGTNLIGGQPISLENIEAVSKIAHELGIILLMDASLLQDNLFFMHEREPRCKGMSIRQITRAVADQFDIIYFSARKFGFGRGGGICIRNRKDYEKMRELVTVFEGFLTYGGMSVREMEAITVGLDETMDEQIVAQGPQFIEFMVNEFIKNGVPVVTPAGGLGCHVNAREFLPHLNSHDYPAAALACAAYIAGGIRGMERGTLSEQREPDGTEPAAAVELLRLAVPRRVFTLSQIKYAIDRIVWLHRHRELIGGLRFIEEPRVLRFFFGKLEPTSDWQLRLAEQYDKDFPNSL
ncbi:MAG: tryptophanase [Clostridia bacterium]|nr:tryptophanase [Clostridia bacterium]